MFSWLTDRRRKKLNEAPFPAAWEGIVRRNVAHYCMLDDAERAHLRDRAEYRDWVEVGSRECLRLKNDSLKGRKSFLNAYAATNEAEFFAVATEQFFDQPRLMVKHASELYRVLRENYRQDPYARFSRNNCSEESYSEG
ncbi:MAG: zinc-dependent peptidase [Deltaproteobacteria bacterium]|nr:zinc-dependent peptidase [Deltaproteobacteria bacterium]